jgi:hypothetical protein
MMVLDEPKAEDVANLPVSIYVTKWKEEYTNRQVLPRIVH